MRTVVRRRSNIPRRRNIVQAPFYDRRNEAPRSTSLPQPAYALDVRRCHRRATAAGGGHRDSAISVRPACEHPPARAVHPLGDLEGNRHAHDHAAGQHSAPGRPPPRPAPAESRRRALLPRRGHPSRRGRRTRGRSRARGGLRRPRSTPAAAARALRGDAGRDRIRPRRRAYETRFADATRRPSATSGRFGPSAATLTRRPSRARTQRHATEPSQ